MKPCGPCRPCRPCTRASLHLNVGPKRRAACCANTGRASRGRAANARRRDHPRCTHPLLGELARHVNDCTSDANRQQLAVLIPSVVGLRGDDPRIDTWIAREAALTALPVVAMSRQRALAVVGGGEPVGDVGEAVEVQGSSTADGANVVQLFTGSAGVTVRLR